MKGVLVRRRIQRAAWWVRRVHGKRILVLVIVAIIAAIGGWLYGGFDSAAFSGLVALGAGILLARPVARLLARLLMRPVPWRSLDQPFEFGGLPIGFQAAGMAGDEPPRRLVDRIANAGGRLESGQAFLEAWLVAADEAGRTWTVVQEVVRPLTKRSVWTSSVDDAMTLADFDDSGKPKVENLKAQGQTMIIVEQSLNVALAFADRAIFMEKGIVRFEGSAQELMERDDLARAVFLGGEGG